MSRYAKHKRFQSRRFKDVTPETSGALYCFLKNKWMPANYITKDEHANCVLSDRKYCFFRGHCDAFVMQSEENLRTTMLFKWMQGEFGPVDAPKITTADVEAIWDRLMESSKVPRFHYAYKYYVDKEVAFWNRLFPELKNEILYSKSGNLVYFGYGQSEEFN